MPKIDLISGYSDWVDLSFAERERTLRQLIELGIRLRLTDLSLSNIVRELEKFGANAVERQSTIGFRSVIYSPLMTQIRIISRSTSR